MAPRVRSISESGAIESLRFNVAVAHVYEFGNVRGDIQGVSAEGHKRTSANLTFRRSLGAPPLARPAPLDPASVFALFRVPMRRPWENAAARAQ
jgi:hypothetical protein